MKKNISINISGIIFHIEEDGYEALRKYLDSINQYFGSFEDSSEILADIESRIAEIFLSKLNEGKQVITAEDVQSLITIMGSVNDFKAAEEQEVTPAAESRQEEKKKTASSSARPASSSKKLFRDERRKILGGVCAGLGHYFNIDPIWPRLLFALVVLGTSGVLILLYVILWIVLPSSGELEEEASVKKMFRNPERKVVGGVASGVAAFFSADVVLIRLLFVIFTIFFGTGLVVYIILWIALPEAKTITEKMQMEGNPITLSNIESSVKKSLNEKDEEESTLAKIILFPFRLIAAILNGLASVLGPLFKVLIEVVRVAAGIIIALIGVSLVISILIAFGLILGAFSAESFSEWFKVGASNLSLPFENIRQAFPTWTAIFAFTAAFIPAMFIVMIGNSILAKKIVFKPVFGWSLFVIFLISCAFLSFSIPQLVYTFKEDADVKVEKSFTINDGTPVFRIKETGLDDYEVTDLALKGHDGNNLRLIERFTAQGSTKMNARENAGDVEYSVVQTDSVVTFDSNISFKKDAKFRFQRLSMELFIPYEKPFVIEEEMWELIDNFWRYDYEGIESAQTFKLNRNGRLECITCPARTKDLSGISADDQFGLKDFDEIEMTGAFDVLIQQGHEFGITMGGSSEDKNNYEVRVKGGTLEINAKLKKENFWKDNNWKTDDLTELTITLPELHKLHITGAGKVKIRGFHEEDFSLGMTGALVGDAKIYANQLSFEASGPVVMELEGEGDFLEASLSGPAQFKASNYQVNRASIEAKGLAQARVNVVGTLEIDKDFTSSVRYSGSPEVIKHD